MNDDLRRAHSETRDAWNANAAYWDEYMGEGNDFVEDLCWPVLERLLALQPGERVFDVACGNGLTSRRLGRLGAQVVAIDFSQEMIRLARARTTPADGAIDYHVVDATDEAALLGLGPQPYQAALSNMALSAMADIDPLFRALARHLVPNGRFVFTVMHPCFNNPHTTRIGEESDREGRITTVYAVKVSGYMTPTASRGLALRQQPQPHIYFHRPLGTLLDSGLRAGFVIDGLEERAFSPDHPKGRSGLSWGGNYSEFPPVLAVCMRRRAG